MPRVSPFLAAVDLVDAGGESDVKFEAETRPHLPVTGVAQIVDAFVAAANAGMFSKEPTATARPLAVKASESPSPCRIRYLWTATGLQLAAYRVLLNMLSAAHHSTELLEGVQLVSSAGGGRRVGTTELFNTPFSLKAGRPPFAVRSRRDLANCREPLIRFEFQRAVSDAELATVLPGFLAWDNVVVRGGYVEDLDRRDPSLDLEKAVASQQTYLAAPSTVEHLFYPFAGQEAAFDALVNMAIRLHFGFCPLVSLEIE